MKKCIAVFVAVILALGCLHAAAEDTAPAAAAEAAAAASTYNVQLAIDKEIAKNVLAQSGIPEEQAGMADAVLDLLNALSIRVISAGGGLQIDLSLNGTDALSLGGTATDDGLVIAGSLFPGYILTVSRETFQGMVQQYMPMTPGETGGADTAPVAEAVSKYFVNFMESFQKAVVPGEAEQGTFEFEGVAFDMKTPVDVDEAALAEAVRKLVQDLLSDDAVKGMFASVPDFDPEKVMEGVNEALSGDHIPEVAAAVYTSSEDSGVSYIVSEAAYEGAEAPGYIFTMLNRGEAGMKMNMLDVSAGTDIEAEYSAQGLRVAYSQGEMYFALVIGQGEDGAAAFDVYVLEKAKPMLTVTVSYAAEGTRTLSLDPEGKTVLAVEELTGGNAAEASMGLIQEIQMNFMQLMSVPEVAGVMGAYMQMLQQTQIQTQPAKAPVQEANPADWKVLRDVMTLETGNAQSSWGGGRYATAFEYGGKYWLVKAAIPDELLDAYEAVDFFAEDAEEQRMAIIGDCEIESVTDLTTLALPQEELDLWIGKTGQDMLDAGWEQNGYSSEGNALVIIMVNGEFQYNVSFGDAVKIPEWGEEADYAGAEIVSVTFGGPSYNFSME